MEMNAFIESSAGRIAARIQKIGVSFDPEVLSLPGGSIIAALLWLYASTRAGVKPATGSPATEPVRPVIKPAAAAACAGCTGQP
jgi:hypothetical protein